jgi:hypothetical protein
MAEAGAHWLDGGTMATSDALPALSDEELRQLLDLTQQSDSVELKLTVPESNQRSAVADLGMDPLDGQVRQIFFFDTPDLALSQHGLVVRARRVQRKGDDSVVKLRPVHPSNLPPSVRGSRSMVVEVDAMPGGHVCSASMKRTVTKPDVKSVVAGSEPISSLFSKDQRAFFGAHAPEGVELDDLAVLGPIPVLKLKFAPEGYDRKLVAELWLYPDGARILELSTKCSPSEAFQVAAEARAFLTGKGVDLSGEQQTKTQTALQFFSEELQSSR